MREAEYGLADGATRIIAIATESARGVFALGTLAGASHRLAGVAWGGEDLAADVGAEANRGPGGLYTDPYRIARAMTLFAAAAAEVDAIDSVYTNFRDLDGLGAECREARRDGFAAKMAIHPAQVAGHQRGLHALRRGARARAARSSTRSRRAPTPASSASTAR